MWIYYNPNPTGRNVQDCAIRALSKALDTDWEHAYALAVANGYQMGDLPNADSVWGAVLRQHGFYRKSIPDTCPSCYTVEQFAEDNPIGTFVLGLGNHAVCVKDGIIWDSFDSSQGIPQFFWYKKEE